MAEYIDRDAAIAACFDGFADCRDDCAANIRSIPAADVRPVVWGRWIWQDAPCFGNPYGSYKCECGCLMPHKTNFCPNCGAQMIGGDDDGRT